MSFVLNPYRYAKKLLLDDYPADAAYSFRKLRTAYSGNCLNVRRSSDDTSQDIGFDANGDVDVAAIATFVGANSGYLRYWYDQSGNGYDLSMTSSNSLQPRIRDAGTNESLNGKFCALTVSSGDHVLNDSGTTGIFQNVGGGTIVSVNTWQTGAESKAGAVYVSTGATPNITRWLLSREDLNFSVAGRRLDGDSWVTTKDGTLALDTQYLIFAARDWSVADLYVHANNVSVISQVGTFGTSGNTSNTSPKRIAVPTTLGSDRLGFSKFQEVIFYNSDQSSNRTQIQNNINDYYSIY